ncbi:MAG TPA: cell division protein FtsQ/DivIB [Solirubrobacteraceae bacterium]
MERSVAARPPISSLDLLWRPFEAVGGLARTSFRSIARHRRLRLVLLGLLVALPLLAGGRLLLRDSSLSSVERVRVSGVHGADARAIEAALAGAARHMSTLDVHPAALRAAVASFPVVRDVRAIPSFPHGLRIEVIEQLPVAALTVNGQRTAVAADGVVLGPALLSSSLPALNGYYEPLPGQHVQGPNLLAALTVLGAAPRPLARLATRVFTSAAGQGLTVAMRGGLLVYFGDAARSHAKWTALARVLADPSSAGASYIDMRLPERPAAGFAPGTTPPESPTSTAAQSTTPESTVAALAAGLTATTGGGSTTAAAPATGAGSSATGESTTENKSPSPAGSSATTEAASTTAAPEAAAAPTPAESPGTSEAETPTTASVPGG